MDSLNILAWNARGAASADFRRVFHDFKLKYKPNIVLLTETRVGDPKAQWVITSLGFNTWYVVEPMGYCGGMWLLWDSDRVKLTVHGNTFQEIHTTVEVQNSHTLFLSFVYGNPKEVLENCFGKILLPFPLLLISLG